MTTVRVAAVQTASVLLDREATIERVAEQTAEAAGQGARLVLFPETFVPGYPDWVWRARPWHDAAWFGRLVEQAGTIPGPTLGALAAIADDHDVYLCVGIDEREPTGSTIYNTLVYLGPDGTLLGRHRKLMPTGAERLVWGQGDGSTLTVFDTPFGRVGGLICPAAGEHHRRVPAVSRDARVRGFDGGDRGGERQDLNGWGTRGRIPRSTTIESALPPLPDRIFRTVAEP